MIERLKTVVIIIGSAYTMSLFISWITHVIMVKGDSNNTTYGYAPFKTFLKVFHNYQKNGDRIDTCHENTIEIKDKCGVYSVYIHASIIRFYDKGMILYPISWFIFKHWLKKYNNKKNKKLWKEKWWGE
jgi:hypothetical protein